MGFGGDDSVLVCVVVHVLPYGLLARRRPVINRRRGGLLVLDRERHTIAFTYFTGTAILEVARCGGCCLLPRPRTDSRHALAQAHTVRHIQTQDPPPGNYSPQHLVCSTSRLADRAVARRPQGGRPRGAHVRLEDNANCLEDKGLKYVYIVRECAICTRDVHTMYFTPDVYISLRPSPLGLCCEERS